MAYPVHRYTLTCPRCGLAHTIDRPRNLRPSAYRYCPACRKVFDHLREEGPRISPRHHPERTAR